MTRILADLPDEDIRWLDRLAEEQGKSRAAILREAVSAYRAKDKDWLEKGDELLRAQIDNLRRRLTLIRGMQLFGAFSLFLCVVSMVAVIGNMQGIAVPSFTVALLLMGASLACLCYEVWISGGALRILLNAVEDRR